jgi:hypothetical protein
MITAEPLVQFAMALTLWYALPAGDLQDPHAIERLVERDLALRQAAPHWLRISPTLVTDTITMLPLPGSPYMLTGATWRKQWRRHRHR